MSRKITEKNAISILKTSKPRKGSYDRLQVAFDMAIKALEKQIPKKVEVWADGSEHCPCCDKNNSGLCFPVCIECGQKLDWGE